jgi:hypothetical protein
MTLEVMNNEPEKQIFLLFALSSDSKIDDSRHETGSHSRFGQPKESDDEK